MLINIEKFLERFSVIKPSKNWAQEEIAKILSKYFNGLEFETENIEFRNGVVFVKTSNAALKNEIFLRKFQILEALKQHFPKHPPVDIRVG